MVEIDFFDVSYCLWFAHASYQHHVATISISRAQRDGFMVSGFRTDLPCGLHLDRREWPSI